MLVLRQQSRGEGLTPGPGERQGPLAFVAARHLNRTAVDQLKLLITKLTQVTRFLGSELVADRKHEASGLCGPPGPGLRTTGVRESQFSECHTR